MKRLALYLFGLMILVATVDAKPLKVYILAGQSNMEGQAKISTFNYIGMDPKTAPMLKEMLGPDGKPKVCDNVYISYLTGGRSSNGEGFGKLTAGYGSRPDPTKPGEKIGPEFTFGIYMNKLLNEPILLIKTAWGGKSINTDFRSPSAGPYEFNAQQLEQFKKRGKNIEEEKRKKAEATGHYYRLMVDHVRKVLGNIKRVYPAYDEKQGYEVAGFVWFQGWNDMCDGGTYPNSKKPGGYDLYTKLLAHFIRDVRKDFKAPKMRFVIAVFGVGGVESQAILRKAMSAPASMPEFKGNVIAVPTAPFWDKALVEAAAKRGKLNQMRDTAHAMNNDGKRMPTVGWKAIGKPAPDERTWRYISFDPQQEKDKLPKSQGKRFRDIPLPAGTEKWNTAEFDDSKWKKGKAPIGKGEWKHRGAVNNKSDWGDGEFLLMRTKFEVDSLDTFDSYRLAILARQGFHVYLNGHKIHTYVWWKNQPYYRSIVLSENETKHLKKGANVLAAYANIHYDRRTAKPYGSIDLFLEGLNKEGMAEIKAAQDKIISPKERAIAAGASNAGYHYMGSGKIMAQIGKACAEAMVGEK